MNISFGWKLKLVLLGVIALALVGCGKEDKPRGQATGNRIVTIAVNQYIHHPNLQAVFDGFQEIIDATAKQKGWQVKYQTQVANGDVATANHIAKQQASDKTDLILALATPSAQASLKSTQTIPIVFGAITDPVGAGLVESLAKPGRNATGTTDQWPYEKQFELIRRLLPNAKIIGIPFNPGEANSVASMKMIKPILEANGFRAKDVAVSNTSELIPAVQSLLKDSDLLFAPADNTVLSGLDALVKLARNHKKPLFVGDEGSVKKGGVATYGIDYHDLGRITGEIAIRILNGEPPASIPVAVGSSARLVLNPDEAARQGIIFPQELIVNALVVKD